MGGFRVSLVKNSQATRQSWLAANCHTCDCPGRSLCTCESGKALQVISVGREDTANVNERAVLVETITAHIQAERENRCMKARLRFRVVRPPSLKEKATWQQTSPMGSSSRGGSTGQRATPLPSGEQQQQQQKEEKEENDHDKEKVTPRTAAARVAELEAENAALRMDRRLLLQEVETLRLLSPSLSSGGPGSNNTSPTLLSGGSSPGGGGGGGNYNYTPLLPSSARQQQPQQQQPSSSSSSPDSPSSITPGFITPGFITSASSITPASESGRKSTTETSPATNSTQRASTPSSPSSLSPSLSLSAGGSAGGRPSGGGRSRPRRLVSTNRFRQSDSLEASSPG